MVNRVNILSTNIVATLKIGSHNSNHPTKKRYEIHFFCCFFFFISVFFLFLFYLHLFMSSVELPLVMVFHSVRLFSTNNIFASFSFYSPHFHWCSQPHLIQPPRFHSNIFSTDKSMWYFVPCLFLLCCKNIEMQVNKHLTRWSSVRTILHSISANSTPR